MLRLEDEYGLISAEPAFWLARTFSRGHFVDKAQHLDRRISASLLPAGQTAVSPDEDDTDPRVPRTIVALRQGLHLLTTFHPELTKDDRFHEYFVRECVLPTLSSRSSSPA